jgi:hypothetical protein
VSFLDHRAEFITHPIVHRQSLVDAPVILKKRTVSPVVNVQRRIADLHRSLERIASEKIFQRCRVRQGNSAQESNAAAGVAEGSAVELVAVEFTPEL